MNDLFPSFFFPPSFFSLLLLSSLFLPFFFYPHSFSLLLLSSLFFPSSSILILFPFFFYPLSYFHPISFFLELLKLSSPTKTSGDDVILNIRFWRLLSQVSKTQQARMSRERERRGWLWYFGNGGNKMKSAENDETMVRVS